MLVLPKNTGQKGRKMAIEKIVYVSLHQTLGISVSYTCLFFLIRSAKCKDLWRHLWIFFPYLFPLFEDLTKSMPSICIKTVIHSCHLHHRSLNVLDTIHLSLTQEVHKVEKKLSKNTWLQQNLCKVAYCSVNETRRI